MGSATDTQRLQSKATCDSRMLEGLFWAPACCSSMLPSTKHCASGDAPQPKLRKCSILSLSDRMDCVCVGKFKPRCLPPPPRRTRRPVALGASSEARVGHSNGFRVARDGCFARHVACNEWELALAGCALQPCRGGGGAGLDASPRRCCCLPPSTLACKTEVAQPARGAPQLAIDAPRVAVLRLGSSRLRCERYKHRNKQSGGDRPCRRRRRHAVRPVNQRAVPGFRQSKGIGDASSERFQAWKVAAPSSGTPVGAVRRLVVAALRSTPRTSSETIRR